MNCPHCLSPLDPSNRYVCNHCNGDLTIDVDQKEADILLLNMAFKSEEIIRKHTVVVLFASLFATMLPMGPLVGACVLFVLSFSIRRHFRGPTKQYIKNTKRRLYAGWLPRVVLLMVGSWVFIFLSAPCFISVSWPITYALLTYGAHKFYASLVTQERDGEPVPTWQTCGLILAIMGILFTIVGLVLAATFIGASLTWLTEIVTLPTSST